MTAVMAEPGHRTPSAIESDGERDKGQPKAQGVQHEKEPSPGHRSCGSSSCEDNGKYGTDARSPASGEGNTDAERSPGPPGKAGHIESTFAQQERDCLLYTSDADD